MNTLIKFSLLYSGAASSLRLLGVIVSLWVATSLPQDSYADWGLLYSVQTGVISFSLVGIVESVVGLLNSYDKDSQRVQLYAAAVSVFRWTGLVTAFLVVIFYFLYLNPHSAGLVALLSVVISGLLLAYSGLQSQIVRLKEDHLSSLFFAFFVPLSGLIGSAVTFNIFGSVNSFFCGSAIGLAIILLLFRNQFANRHPFLPQNTIHLQLFSRLAPFIIVTFLGWLSGYGNNFLVQRFFGPVEVAKFTFALTVSSIPQLVSASLNQVWAPRFYKLTHCYPFDEVESRNIIFYNLQCILLGLLGAVSIIVFPHLLSAIGGNLLSYLSMRYEICLLFVAYILLAPWTHAYNYLLAYDKGRHVMNIVIATSAIGILLWLLLMLMLGPMGIYVGFLSQMFLRSAGIYIYSRRFWPLRVGWLGLIVGSTLPLSALWATRGF